MPEQEVIFRQTHEPGLCDFSEMGDLGVSIYSATIRMRAARQSR